MNTPVLTTPRELLQECMESAVRLAFIRHSEEIEFDADADTEEEIANDAACACFAEGTCTEEPIEEVAIALKRLEAFNDMLSALKELVRVVGGTLQGYGILEAPMKAAELAISKAEKQP